MRLTLRTLLAYRDGVLSSAETSDLHQRIKQTEVANNLMRRIELLMQQKQMLAPKVIGTGLGADANSVAEYLDDTLASDQVAEFERICIAESDLVLTELAHCHQLLADALNSKVHVPANLKTLVGGLTDAENQAVLASRIRPARNSDKASDSITSFIAADGTQRRVDTAHSNALVPAQVVSNEIKEAQDIHVKAAAVLANGKAAESVVKQSASDGKALVTAPIDVMNSQVSKPQSNATIASPKQSHHVPDYLVTTNSGGWKFPLAILAVLGLFVVLAVQALGPLSNIQSLFVAQSSTNQSEKPAASDVKAKEIGRGVDVVKQLPPEPVVPVTVPAVKEQAVREQAVEPIDKEATGTAEPEQPIAPESDATSAVDSEKPNEGNVNPTLPNNRSISWNPATDAESRSVVFVQPVNGEPRSFSRLSPDSPIGNDIALIVPPAMRPRLNLADVCSWTACGPSKILPSMAADGSLLIKTSLCRALLKANAAGRSLTMIAPAGSVDLAFNEATSGASIEVAYRTASAAPITDRNAFKPILIVVAVEGEITVTSNPNSDEAKKPIRLNVGEGVALIDGQATEFELGTIPAWYRTNADRQIDLLAAEDMHQLLFDGSNIEARLNAMCTERRPETSALAIQSSSMLGDWSGFANNLLNDEMMRTHWATTLALAEQLLADDPKQIESLSHELEAVFGESSNTLTSLLTGSNAAPQSSENQKAFQQELVDSLTNDQLPVRVLAAYQLLRLTGRDFGFQPATPNRTAVQQWRRELATNKLGSLLNANILWEAKRGESEH